MAKRNTEQVQEQTNEVIERCTTADFTPEGTVIASGFDSGIIRLWNIKTKKEMMVLKGHKKAVLSLAFTRDGKTLVSGGADRRILIWDPFKGELLRTLRGHGGAINSLSFSADGKYLASASADKRIRIWEIARGWKKVKELKGHKDSIATAKFHPKKPVILSAAWDHLVYYWNFETGKIIGELKGHYGPIYDLVFSPDGNLVATCSSDGSIKTWITETKKERSSIATSKAGITSIDFHPKDDLLVGGLTDHTIKLWQLTDGKLVKTLKEHDEGISQVRFSASGQKLLTISLDGELKLWDIAQLLAAEPKSLLEKAKDVVTGGSVRKFASELWSKSVGKIIEEKQSGQPERDETATREEMLKELPQLISVMKEGETIPLTNLETRYLCSKELAEEVIIQLLKESKISGSFDPFKGLLTIAQSEAQKAAVQVEDQTADLVELNQTCFYCGSPINANTVYCPSCQEKITVCPVCRLSIDFDDEVGVCIYCGTKGHLSHMKEAVKVAGKCPVCRKQLNWDNEITVFQRTSNK